jgi:hypothetical protein
VGKADRRGNLYPAKQRPERKIGAAVALMMAVGRAVAEDTNECDLDGFLRNPVMPDRPARRPGRRRPPVDARRLERRRRASELQAPAP